MGATSDVTRAVTDDAAATIVVSALHRSYRKRAGWFGSREVVEAVRGINFAVPAGTIHGLLGPNGAGKTTTIKMLSTLLIPTAGRASVAGFDVVTDEVEVRRRLGVLFGGDKGLYNQLSARENLRYFGHLYGMRDAEIAVRSPDLLERVGLSDRADERVESYSRGMKQRLHIAKTLIHDPPVVILDEPTIGLDPGAAIEVRELIRGLVPRRTVMLSTHDMHEADVLCDRVAIVDRGRIVAEGTPRELKQAAAVERSIEIVVTGALDGTTASVVRALRDLPSVVDVSHRPGPDDTLTLGCRDTAVALDHALALLRTERIAIRSLDVHEPTLEDAFLGATGRAFEPQPTEPAP